MRRLKPTQSRQFVSERTVRQFAAVTGLLTAMMALSPFVFGPTGTGELSIVLPPTVTQASSISLKSIASSTSLPCSDVLEQVAKGHWADPNDGQIFSRSLVTDPHFVMSVHNESYDPVRWEHIYRKGKYYEDLVHSRFLEILNASSPKDSVVVDVGANIGYYTLLSIALGYHVLSFEINPANILRICESLQLNHWESDREASLFQHGVSNTHGSALQVLVPKNPGQAYMKEMELNSTSSMVTPHHAFTTTVTLDEFARERGWFDRSDFSIAILKLDVEGKEPQIIEGARRLLQTAKVRNILTEFRRLGRDTIQQAISTLLEAGYTVVDKGGKLSLEESRQYLKDLEKKLHGTGKNVDLWFQK